MPNSAIVAELAPVYAAALVDPRLSDELASIYRAWPETGEVLAGSLDTLWQNVLGSSDPASSTPLDSGQKAWLLLHAGLLRGFNLAAITAWRRSADGIDGLDLIYPGFVAYGEALHRVVAPEFLDLSVPAGLDRRSDLTAVAGRARRLLALGLERGYGVGMLVDLALERASLGRTPYSTGLSPDADIRRAVLAVSADRDPELARRAAAWAGEIGPSERRETLAAIRARKSDGAALDAAIAERSRLRPLAVPATIARFSAPYVVTMLAYLAKWWFTVGVRLGRPDAPAAPVATRTTGQPRLACQSWLHRQARAWAVEEAVEFDALRGDPAGLRWWLADFAQLTTALGWRFAREVLPD